MGTFSETATLKRKFGWRELSIDIEPLNTKLIGLKGNQNFKVLSDLKNFRKHGALPRVKNEYVHLEINIDIKGVEKYVKLLDLMHELHNKLMPKYFEILDLTFKTDENFI